MKHQDEQEEPQDEDQVHDQEKRIDQGGGGMRMIGIMKD
jgi:hypothetical protein